MKNEDKNQRRGAILAMTGILLTVLLGIVACAMDIGWIHMTRAELQNASDAAVLSTGPEIVEGLGRFATLTPAQVEAAARPMAVTYAGLNRNGDVAATYVNPTDIQFGYAVYDETTGWSKNWGSTAPDTGYNMIRVVTYRDKAPGATANDDHRLPLFLGPVLNRTDQPLFADATGVIMPVNGFRVVPGDPTTASIIPFAFAREVYNKYLAAQAYYAAHNGVMPSPMDPRETGADPNLWLTPPSGDPGDNGDPLFGHFRVHNNGSVDFIQDFFDVFSIADQTAESSPIVAGSDGYLEVDLYPSGDDATAGNFGTIDLGNTNNSTQELSRQISEGLNASDFAEYDDNTITMPIEANGETGISVGMKSALDTILGECRAMALFSGVINPGDTATFSLDGWAGMRLVEVELEGALQFKRLRFQLCQFSASGGIGDITESVGEDTTVFTPMILIE